MCFDTYKTIYSLQSVDFLHCDFSNPFLETEIGQKILKIFFLLHNNKYVTWLSIVPLKLPRFNQRICKRDLKNKDSVT